MRPLRSKRSLPRPHAALLLVLLTGPLVGCGSSSTTGSATSATDLLQFTGASLLPAYVGEPYSASVQITGGVGPYTLRLSDGKLPDGLTLSGSTISGRATTPGQADFTVEVSDANLSVRSQKLSLTVATLPPLSVALTLPAGEVRGETRLPLTITSPRGVRALRYRLTVPAGLRVVRAAPADSSAVGFWRVSGNVLTLDLGFRREPLTGSVVGLVTVAPSAPMTLTTGSMPSGYSAFDGGGKSIVDQPLPGTGTRSTPSVPSGTPSVPAATSPAPTGTLSPSTPSPSTPNGAPVQTAPVQTAPVPIAPVPIAPVQTVPDPSSGSGR